MKMMKLFIWFGLLMKVFFRTYEVYIDSDYLVYGIHLCITCSTITEEMTFTGEIHPHVISMEDQTF